MASTTPVSQIEARSPLPTEDPKMPFEERLTHDTGLELDEIKTRILDLFRGDQMLWPCQVWHGLTLPISVSDSRKLLNQLADEGKVVLQEEYPLAKDHEYSHVYRKIGNFLKVAPW